MDLNYLREPAMLVFSLAMVIEFYVTVKVFHLQHRLDIKPGLEWWIVATSALQAAWNGNAAYEVYNNPALGEALITKLGYCVLGLSFMLWLLAFSNRESGAGNGKT